MQRLPLIAILLCLSIPLAACQPASTPQATHTPTAELPTATATMQPKLTIPASPTPTSTSTMTPTWTPWPTVSETEKLDRFLEIWEMNGGCKPPCVWGIMPGKTTTEDLNNLLSPFSYMGGVLLEDGATLRHDFSIDAPPQYDRQGFGYISAVFFTQRNIVHTIQIALVNVSPNYNPEIHEVLETFGKPEKILISVIPESGGREQGHYLLFLHYPKQGIAIDYRDNLYIFGTKKFICPQFTRNPLGPRPFLHTWDPTDQIAFHEIIPNFEYYQPVEIEDEFPGYGVPEFYNDYTNPATQDCLETRYTVTE